MVSVWSGDEFDCEIYLKFNQEQAELLPKNLRKRNQFCKIKWIEYTVYVHSVFFFFSLFTSMLRICVLVQEWAGRVALSARVHSRIIVTSLSNPSVCLSPAQSISINTRSPSEGRLYISSLNRTSRNSPKWLTLPVWLTHRQNLYAAQRVAEHPPNKKKIKINKWHMPIYERIERSAISCCTLQNEKTKQNPHTIKYSSGEQEYTQII